MIEVRVPKKKHFVQIGMLLELDELAAHLELPEDFIKAMQQGLDTRYGEADAVKIAHWISKPSVGLAKPVEWVEADPKNMWFDEDSTLMKAFTDAIKMRTEKLQAYVDSLEERFPEDKNASYYQDHYDPRWAFGLDYTRDAFWRFGVNRPRDFNHVFRPIPSQYVYSASHKMWDKKYING